MPATISTFIPDMFLCEGTIANFFQERFCLRRKPPTRFFMSLDWPNRFRLAAACYCAVAELVCILLEICSIHIEITAFCKLEWQITGINF